MFLVERKTWKTLVKNLEIGSLTLKNDDDFTLEMGILPPKNGGRDVLQRRSGDFNRRDVDDQHRDSRQRWTSRFHLAEIFDEIYQFFIAKLLCNSNFTRVFLAEISIVQ